MVYLIRINLFILMVIVLAACAGDRSAEQTLSVQHASRSTQVAVLRSTVTRQADNRLITQEYLATESTRVKQRQREIITTLNALGYNASDVSMITPQATNTPAQSVIDVGVTAPPIDGGSGGITRLPPTEVLRTLAPTATVDIPTVAPTVDPSAPQVVDVVTARNVGNDDCATDVTAQFSPNDQSIYIVMRARNFVPGTSIVSHWFQDGTEVATFEFAPDFAIDDACIWFFADQTDFAFTAGAVYEITLDINGQPFGDVIRFAILEQQG